MAGNRITRGGGIARKLLNDSLPVVSFRIIRKGGVIETPPLIYFRLDIELPKQVQTKLSTIQTLDWYEELCRSGAITGAWKFVDQDWLSAYQWMSSEMKKKIGGLRNASPPTWAWFQYRSGRPRPDLRRSWHLPRGTLGVRIEFQVDAANVLLSDFQKWHAVLNGWYLARNEDESNWWRHESPSLSEREKLTRIRKSWERIFEFANETHDDFWNAPGGLQIQACVWSLKKSDIIDVTHFIAR